MKIHGEKIAITSAAGHSREAFRKLAKLGARVFSTPLVKIKKREFKIPKSDAYAFTSVEGVNAVLGKLGKRGFLKRFNASRVFAIGPLTGASLRKIGIRPRVPEKYHSSSLAKLVLKSGANNIVAFRSSRAGSEMKGLLRGKVRYREIAAYEINPIKRRIDAAIIFVTSATAAKALPKTAAFMVSIGPHTSEALKTRGMSFIEARRHTLDGMITALKRAKTVTA
ncbi:MAG: uroporphyrinogen-III synthase [Candidatus Aenigmarchaeota archaeon]|nr:uroporphyrinogen-III synthase [Candidatus Aenigmarchaeota archaeon]